MLHFQNWLGSKISKKSRLLHVGSVLHAECYYATPTDCLASSFSLRTVQKKLHCMINTQPFLTRKLKEVLCVTVPDIVQINSDLPNQV